MGRLSNTTEKPMRIGMLSVTREILLHAYSTMVAKNVAFITNRMLNSTWRSA